jgi:hypothetical protein
VLLWSCFKVLFKIGSYINENLIYQRQTNNMKIIYLIALLICTNTFSQNFSSIEEAMENANKKNERFKEYSVFEHSTQKINSSLREIAPDIQSISVSKSALSLIQKETPEFIHFYVYHEDDTLSVKMQRQQVITDDFKVRNQDGRVLKYKPGLYCRFQKKKNLNV